MNNQRFKIESLVKSGFRLLINVILIYAILNVDKSLCSKYTLKSIMKIRVFKMFNKTSKVNKSLYLSFYTHFVVIHLKALSK